MMVYFNPGKKKPKQQKTKPLHLFLFAGIWAVGGVEYEVHMGQQSPGMKTARGFTENPIKPNLFSRDICSIQY